MGADVHTQLGSTRLHSADEWVVHSQAPSQPRHRVNIRAGELSIHDGSTISSCKREDD